MQPVFLIGAARSGTKVLRDVLAEHPAVDAVPFDVNYLWRLGHEDLPDDVIEVPLSDRAVEGITAELANAGSGVVVEKTVSSCLRVPAIAAAFPEARFVFLVRDGFDVTESSMRQWQAPVDWRYSAKKALSFPWLKAPGYALRHLRSSLSRASGDQTATWGPRYPGIDADVRDRALVEVCAIQWASSITSACDGFDQAGIRPHVVRYEDFATNTLDTINSIHRGLELDAVSKIQRLVESSQIGKGRRSLSSSDVDLVESTIANATTRLDEWLQRR